MRAELGVVLIEKSNLFLESLNKARLLTWRKGSRITTFFGLERHVSERHWRAIQSFLCEGEASCSCETLHDNAKTIEGS